MTSSIDTPVWFITGCSTGFGQELALGWRAVVTARDPSRLDSLLAGADAGERAWFKPCLSGCLPNLHAAG